MRYAVEIEINRDKAGVTALFTGPDNLKKWQPELLSAEPLNGPPGETGSTCCLRYRMGKAVLEMRETVVENGLPDRFVATYEADKVWNKAENTFTETRPGTTTWRMDTEFRFRGFMRVVGLIFPGSFKKQTRKSMERFKAFMEEEG